MKKFCLLTSLTLLFLSFDLEAQTDSLWHQKPELSLSGFIDVFYVYDWDQPEGSSRQPFLYNHNRHNEFNLNLGLIKLGLESSKYRANLAIHTGTYANDNYAAEPGLLKNIFEANIGISLNRDNNLWLDAGIIPSHIGAESAISSDNPTLLRSLPAENSPYFLTGAKLTFAPSDEWQMAFLILNGWQRIQRVEGNSLPSFGTQVVYSPDDFLTLNWSTFIGTDDPDPIRRMRYFNNLYGQFQLSDRFGILAGFDLGMQQEIKGSSSYNIWWSPVLIGTYEIDETWKMGFRAEHYRDDTGVIIPTGTASGFQTTGLSFNLDYAPSNQVICRLEGRWLGSKDAIFESNGSPSDSNFVIATSIAIKFTEVIAKGDR